MEKKSLVLSVKLASVFEDKEARIKFGFKFNEKFEARKLDKETGEFVIKNDNELSFTKKQFNFAFQDNFVITVMSQQINYAALEPIEMIAMFKGVELTVDRTRLEQGDTYIDINGEEQTADDTVFLTELKDIKFGEKNMSAIKRVIIKQAEADGKSIDADMLDLIL